MDARDMSYSFVIPTLMLFPRKTNRQIGIDRIHLLLELGEAYPSTMLPKAASFNILLMMSPF
jgi:hypothetical protein